MNIGIGYKVKLNHPPIHRNKVGIIIAKFDKKEDDDYDWYVFIDKEYQDVPIWAGEIAQILSTKTCIN